MNIIDAERVQVSIVYTSRIRDVEDPPYNGCSVAIHSDMNDSDNFDYDIALSFAGEDRSLVEELAEKLKHDGVRVFYDAYEKAALWGKDLYQHLQIVYRDRARYCIIFVSAAYASKVWTRHELKQAQSRAFKEHSEYILPLRLDDTEIPGLNATTGYIDLRENELEEVRKVVLQKLFGDDVKDEDLPELTWQGELIDFRGCKVASFWPAKLARAQAQTTYTFEIPRIRYGDELQEWLAKGVPCHDCGAIKGEYHVDGCDVEECPVCRGQKLSCDCVMY